MSTPADLIRTRIFRAGIVRDAAGEPNKDPSRTVFLASDDGLDRYNTRVAQDWLDDGRIAAFDANPVVPWGHDYAQAPVGRVASREVQDIGPGRRGLVVEVEWDMDDPYAAKVAGKYARGVLSAVSVGFRSGRMTPLKELDDGHPWRAESGYMLAGNELMDISAVTVPGNPRAIAMREAGWLSGALVEAAPEDLRSLVRDMLSTDPETRRLIAEAAGDLHDTTAAHAVAEVRKALGPSSPWAWLWGDGRG